MGALKNLYLFLIFLFSIGIFTFVVFYDEDVKYNVHYVDELESDSNTVNIYLLDENNEIKPLKVNVEDKNDYQEIFSFYNEKMNSFEVGYSSPLVFSAEIKSIECFDDTLIIKIDKLSAESDNNKLMECLLKTYNELGVNTITLEAGKSTLIISS